MEVNTTLDSLMYSIKMQRSQSLYAASTRSSSAMANTLIHQPSVSAGHKNQPVFYHNTLSPLQNYEYQSPVAPYHYSPKKGSGHGQRLSMGAQHYQNHRSYTNSGSRSQTNLQYQHNEDPKHQMINNLSEVYQNTVGLDPMPQMNLNANTNQNTNLNQNANMNHNLSFQNMQTANPQFPGMGQMMPMPGYMYGQQLAYNPYQGFPQIMPQGQPQPSPQQPEQHNPEDDYEEIYKFAIKQASNHYKKEIQKLKKEVEGVKLNQESKKKLRTVKMQTGHTVTRINRQVETKKIETKPQDHSAQPTFREESLEQAISEKLNDMR